MTFHRRVVLVDHGAHDAIPVLEVILEGHRVAGPRFPIYLPQAHSIDAAGSKESLGGADQGDPRRFSIAGQWTAS
jgi:hypothetical protein